MQRKRRDARVGTEGESQRPQFFEGFNTEQIKTSGATINTVYGGNRNGAPLLLLHGISGDACALAQGRTDAIAGLFRRDDGPARLRRQQQAAWRRRSLRVLKASDGARSSGSNEASGHWFLLVQPPPFPETMVQNSAEYFLKCTLLWLGGSKLTDPLPDWISSAVFDEYLRTFRQPDTIHAICEDYRAAASIDLVHDNADLNKKIQCPLLVLSSEKGPFHRMYNVPQTWQERAIRAQGKAMPTGHFLPEQMPQELMQEIITFMSA